MKRLWGGMEMTDNFSIPVVLITFKRPDLVRQQLERLRQVRPEKLFWISDAARSEHDGETELVEQTRKLTELVNWPCEIVKIFASENMGCDRRIVSGLNEVFGLVDKAIILEDDCLPSLSFFPFCREMLLKYEQDSDIMYVSGTKKVPQYHMDYTYGFSYDTGTWGWATWRRAWSEWHWDREEWNQKRADFMKDVYTDGYRKRWIENVEKYFDSTSIPWDYIWTFCVGKRISIFPSVNLVGNVGFDEGATHTTEPLFGYDSTVGELSEIVHPPVKKADLKYLHLSEKQFKVPLWYRVKRKILKTIGLW